LKILRVEGNAARSSQHNPISSVVVVQSTLTGSTLPSSRETRPTECLTNTFVFWSFSSCVSMTLF